VVVTFLSLCSERHHWIHPGRSAGRERASEEADRAEEERRREVGNGISGTDLEEKPADQLLREERRRQTKHEPDHDEYEAGSENGSYHT
jgi:hypothetical protein